ncbi:ketopantoate reductase [Mycolicibacterium aromaticivorans JS19b1 = JCM 16368]|uniref:2-dehydropantoate 2-reductase n=1 Tax=Mycolicibacterium aromaticivorans JS19b1 = JCM 16368 TaxID=1440774 RepID=A0A064CE15_9MYCO|nr:2-dehydropantoate 2-reductase [Mycolicibacterium aromaticivorans]KDE96997.1 ketopantoate reductase [Mycolicibacterium aromaticivorans JS19b1 = JCM 16368]
MRMLILGAGGLGSILGGYLANIGVEVTLVGRPAHTEAITRDGLRITGRRGDLVIKDNLRAVDQTAKATGHFDYLVLAVKGKDTAQALADAAGLRDVVSSALSVQNTVEKDATLAGWLGPDRVIGASTIEGGTLLEPGLVRNHLTAEVTAYFGELDGSSSARVDDLTTAFTAAGLPAVAVGNIEQVEWEKLAQIALAAAWSVTALGAIPGTSVFEGMEVPEGAKYFVALAKDLMAVYRAMGYEPMNFYAPLSRLKELDALPTAEAIKFVIRQGKTMREQGNSGHPSMYEDVLRRRKTEVDFMLKPYLAAAEELALDVPTLRVAYQIIKTIDRFLA